MADCNLVAYMSGAVLIEARLQEYALPYLGVLHELMALCCGVRPRLMCIL